MKEDLHATPAALHPTDKAQRTPSGQLQLPPTFLADHQHTGTLSEREDAQPRPGGGGREGPGGHGRPPPNLPEGLAVSTQPLWAPTLPRGPQMMESAGPGGWSAKAVGSPQPALSLCLVNKCTGWMWPLSLCTHSDEVTGDPHSLRTAACQPVSDVLLPSVIVAGAASGATLPGA